MYSLKYMNSSIFALFYIGGAKQNTRLSKKKKIIKVYAETDQYKK